MTINTTRGITFSRRLTVEGEAPLHSVEWVKRDALIADAAGKVVFEQKDVAVPANWSETALKIAASKYLHGKLGTSERETGIDALIMRVASTIHKAGVRQGYFASDDSGNAFLDELVYLLVNQYAAFNSPVWFNVGCAAIEPDNKGKNAHWNFSTNQVEVSGTGYDNPQCSACFINSVKDSMESVMDLAKTEAMLFKWGSGSGSNLSPLRGSTESLSGGGTSSGPLSFMRGFDAFAGVVKSGGKTRRAAKMVVLDADHPDIAEFIACKGKEEKKAHILVAAGYDGSGPDSEAYSSVFFQNANNSVRVTDAFMEKALSEENNDWNLVARTTAETVATVSARSLLRSIVEETWQSGDPGMQFDTTINGWHTCPESGRINASNPCSEYMFLDDSACNLASFNLLKYLKKDGSFDGSLFYYHVRLLIIAQDILVDLAGYPTAQIAQNSHDYRPLGLGYANLGALLLRKGLAYDSEEGRKYAALITSLMGGAAYHASARLAEDLSPLTPANAELSLGGTGAFPGYRRNRAAFLSVIERHRSASEALQSSEIDPVLYEDCNEAWDAALSLGTEYGFRNAQVTVLAPTGTIGFLMDCDTTGVEPMLGLVVYKKLVGGGYMTLVNQAVPKALASLGYSESEMDAITHYIETNSSIEGAPGFKDEHLPIFDCALKPASGTRTINWKGHVDMMAAVQPFLSGAISKTVNMPPESTIVEIEAAYIHSWKQGLKAVAIYRDGSKTAQPMSVSKEKETVSDAAPTSASNLNSPPIATRHRLPDERPSLTHKFRVGNQEGYINVGIYADGQPGEIFIRMAKEGSTLSGLMDGFATAVSIGLQHGVPLKVLCSKFSHMSFEPSGWTGSDEFGYAKSIFDYLFRWLDLRFLQGDQLDLFGGLPNQAAAGNGRRLESSHDGSIGVPCRQCGGNTRAAGRCRVCETCGSTDGGCS